MPGIFGFISDRPFPRGGDLLREMGSLLSSHSTHASMAICGGHWGLGASWIQGLQVDPEPLAPEDGGPCSVATGEVYPTGSAAPAPPVSPRGAILDALGSGDPARLSRVNGQFAGAVFDPRTGVLSVACDRYALHQVYYTWRDGLFSFASELKALLAVPGLPTDLDSQGLASLLLLGEQFGDTTILGAVKVAPAAALVRSSGGKPDVQSWWRIRFGETIPLREKTEAVEEAGRLFRQAVARQTADAPRIGVPLSGGLDSRICLAAIPGSRREAATTFTWGDRGCLDRRIARRVSARCRATHQDHDYRYQGLLELAEQGVWLTDGMAGCADFHILPFLDEMAAHCNVVLNGFAGDAILGGSFHWPKIRNLPPTEIYRVVFAKRNDCLPLSLAAKHIRGAAGNVANELLERYSLSLAQHLAGDSLSTIDAFLLDSRVRRWTSFGTQMLRSRLVSRAPFYDNDFFDLMTSIPSSWRTDHQLYRPMLCRTFPEVADMTWQRSGFPASWPPRVFKPAGSVARRVAGLLERKSGGRLRSPYPVARVGAAFRGPLAPRIEASLFGGSTPLWDLVDRGFAEGMWKEFVAGSERWTKLIGVLISLRLFLERFLHPRAPGRSPADTQLVEVRPRGVVPTYPGGG